MELKEVLLGRNKPLVIGVDLGPNRTQILAKPLAQIISFARAAQGKGQLLLYDENGEADGRAEQIKVCVALILMKIEVEGERLRAEIASVDSTTFVLTVSVADDDE